MATKKMQTTVTSSMFRIIDALIPTVWFKTERAAHAYASGFVGNRLTPKLRTVSWVDAFGGRVRVSVWVLERA